MSDSDRRDRGALVALGLMLAAIVLVAAITAFDKLGAQGIDADGNRASEQTNLGKAAGGESIHDNFNPWHDFYDQYLAAFAGAGSVGVSLLALVWLRKTWRETERTANAAFAAVELAREANAISRETAQRQLRAYIGIDHVDPQRFVVGATPLFGIILKNTGTTPAKHFRHAVFLGAGPKGQRHRFATESGDVSTSASVDIGAGGQYLMIATGDLVISESLFQAVVSKETVFEIAAYASYLDVFNKRHRLIFRAYVDLTQGVANVLASDRHNRSN